MESLNEYPLLIVLTAALITAVVTLFLSRSYWLIRHTSLLKEKELLHAQLTEKQELVLAQDAELRGLRDSETDTQLKLREVHTEKNNLEDKLTEQRTELTDLHKQLYNQFEVMAHKILDSKSEQFSKLNERQIKQLIEPLGKDIEAFKKKVDQEANERFSLGVKVKELAELNNSMSEVAINLTKALKGESKTQGNWGEMILESILERSGLRKDEQYFMEHQLKDKKGKALRSQSKDEKMRPDALIKYPDERNVIVDSKVSLTAFARALDTDDEDIYRIAIAEHVASVKTHINSLSSKGYDDFDRSLDFVLMFVPSEPAYIAAMQEDPELWNYAYDRRILLQSPTNLITSLKLIEELWKREAHNQNAQAIAARGAKLYDKFVGFVENLEDVGKHLDKAKERYDAGYKQLSTGPGNLVGQANKLKGMIGKTKKELASGLVESIES